MPDIHAIDSMCHGAPQWSSEDTELQNKQTQYITDSGSTYSSGIIQFCPSQNGMSDQWINYSDPACEITIPLQISFPNFPSGAPQPQVGFKGSTLSLVNQVQIESQSQSLVSEGTNSAYFVNTMKLAVERGVNWLATEAATIHYSVPDSAHLASAYPSATGANTMAFTQLSGTGSPVSTAVAMSIQYFNDSFTWVGTTGSGQTATLTGMVRLPPKYLHSLMENLNVARLQLDFVRLLLNLGTATTSPIFVIPASLPASYTTMPTISVLGNNSCSFRFPVLTPTSAQARKAEAQWNSEQGYWYTTTAMGLQQNNQTASSNVQALIQASVVRGERIWLNLLPSQVSVTFPNGGGSATPTTATYLPTSCYDLLPFFQDSTYSLTELNLIAGSGQVYAQNLCRSSYLGFNYDEMFYQFLDAAPNTLIPGDGHGGLVDKFKWRHSVHYNLLSIAREQSFASNLDNPQQVQVLFSIQGGAPVTAPYNLVPIIQTMDYAVMHKGRIQRAVPPKKR